MTALELLKSVEDRESLYLIVNDHAYKSVLVAWTHMEVRCTDIEYSREGRSMKDVSDMIWKSCGQMDYEKLSSLSGIPYNVVVEKFLNLKRMNLIYPDGTISVNAGNLIRAEVASHIQSLMPRAGNPTVRARPRPSGRRKPTSRKK